MKWGWEMEIKERVLPPGGKDPGLSDTPGQLSPKRAARQAGTRSAPVKPVNVSFEHGTHGPSSWISGL